MPLTQVWLALPAGGGFGARGLLLFPEQLRESGPRAFLRGTYPRLLFLPLLLAS